MFVLAGNAFVWLLTLSLGLASLWFAVRLLKGRFDDKLKGVQHLNEASRRAYSNRVAAIFVVVAAWYLALAVIVLWWRLDRSAWLALFGVGPVLAVFGVRWAGRPYGIS